MAEELSCHSLAQNQALKAALGNAAEVGPMILSTSDLHNGDIITHYNNRETQKHFKQL